MRPRSSGASQSQGPSHGRTGPWKPGPPEAWRDSYQAFWENTMEKARKRASFSF